ncbi:Tyrosine phosphatase family protein [Singulisphaera sp. GP187]|uniref:tyrosine-protein phosphatase n=1 Tax=Singulisphaera sp. GP187 TaxID=1882752 RepID=UPI00092B3A7B|nr:tyrosine-protein phosphatase [Singulisphaera sp. GP187]SIO62673.1 Tyrosine phosphatase family protein [Singulisphaera sp. GP187]
MTQSRTRQRRQRRLVVVGLLLVVAWGVAFLFRNPLFHRNFGVVAKGLVYRSAQPEANLKGLIKTYKLGSILNLRGGGSSDPFYTDEVGLVSAEGVDFYDYPMSATQRPKRRDLLTLIDLFQRCRYPLLIHCKSGSDRTGLASGLYLMVRSGTPPEKALEAFSLFYGHVPLLGPENLHEPFLEYADWLKRKWLVHSPERFRAWVETEYRANDPVQEVQPLRKGPRAVLRAGLAARRGAARPVVEPKK